MAVKTITIDMEAYDTLSRHKRAGQSFSQVIKAHFGPQPTAGRLLERIRTIRLSDDALDAMDAVVRDRRRHPARAIHAATLDDASLVTRNVKDFLRIPGLRVMRY